VTLEVRLRREAEEDLEDVLVIAIIHGSRHPRRWQGRA